MTMAMTMPERCDEARFVLRNVFDGAARGIEFVGDVELADYIETVMAWCEGARDSVRPRLDSPAKKKRTTKQKGILR
jgi:hypothetical protein